MTTASAPAQFKTVEIASPRTANNGQRNVVAALITFVVAAIALYASIGYLQEISRTMASVDATNTKMLGQMDQANKGLAGLKEKTAAVAPVAATSKELGQLMSAIDGDMGEMLTGVNQIAGQMNTLGASLGKLDADIAATQSADAAMFDTLGTISGGLKQQSRTVAGMRKDLGQTAVALTQMPGTLEATNQRLAHVNKIVCFMGRNGLQSEIQLGIEFIGINTGTARIGATIVPPGSWC